MLSSNALAHSEVLVRLATGTGPSHEAPQEMIPTRRSSRMAPRYLEAGRAAAPTQQQRPPAYYSSMAHAMHPLSDISTHMALRPGHCSPLASEI